MRKKHNFVLLAETQRWQQTSYNAGLDIHGFKSYQENMDIYGSAIPSISSSEFDIFLDAFSKYRMIVNFCQINDESTRIKLAKLLSALEMYLKKLIDIYIVKARIFTFKPQASFYEQLGPGGMVLLSEIRRYIKEIAKKNNVPSVCMLDCKRGDIFTTQAAYFNAYLGNLSEDWGIDYSPYDFDIINVTPWMGRDVMVLYDKDKDGNEIPAKGLNLMRDGKGIIGVNKTSNPSGPEYQELSIDGQNITLQMKHVIDMKEISKKEKLENRGLSTIGLVVGSTHICDGSIRRLFPGTTMLVPGFGAQGGKFFKIMLELIRSELWNGQGAIFSSSRGSMYPFLSKFGGSGDPKNLEKDALAAVIKFRKAEYEAYQTEEVIAAGIRYPYSSVVW